MSAASFFALKKASTFVFSSRHNGGLASLTVSEVNFAGSVLYDAEIVVDMVGGLFRRHQVSRVYQEETPILRVTTFFKVRPSKRFALNSRAG